MRLRAKLLLAQLPLGIALVVVAGVSVFTVAALGESSQTILKDNYRSVLAAQRMKEAGERLDSAALFVVAGEREKGLQQARVHRARFEAELRVQENNVTEPGEREASNRLRAAWESYRDAFDHFLALPAESDLAAPYFHDLEPRFLAVKDGADRILEINQDAMVRKSDWAAANAERLNRLVIAVSLVALGLGLAVSIALTTRLLRPLDDLTNVARRLGEGDVEARAMVRTQDEIGELGRELNQMAERVAQYRQSTLGELLQAQESSQAAIDSIPDPVIVFDAERNVLNLNEVAERLLDAWQVPAGESPLVRAEPGVRSALERVVEHVLSGHGPFVPRGFEEAVRAPSTSGGGDTYLMPRASPLYDAKRGIAGVTVILQDVTKLRRFEELRNDLVATVAHEFRTPLTSLRMAIHMCIEGSAGPLTPTQADLLYTGRDDCERLQRIVDDLLDLARLQSGKADLDLKPTVSEDLLEAAREAHLAEARQRDLTIEVEPSPSAPVVLADRDRVDLVLSNFLTNAIRHTPAGGRIALRLRELSDAVRFEVSDTGPGIPAEHRERIFDRFFRVPGSPSGGSGLGLSIAHEIVTAHGGAIGVEGEPGQGATFWFTLPAGA